MSKKRKERGAAYRRFDLRERRAIEHALDKRMSCREIARDLGRSASSVHDEVVRNRIITRGGAKGENVVSADFEQAKGDRVCPRLQRWPFCCNGCKYAKYGRACNMRFRCEYRAPAAEALAREKLIEPRRGVDMDPTSFEQAVSLIRSDLARGLSPRQIAEGRAGEVGVSASTIYRWIDEGYGGMSNIELRRKVGYKPRKKRRESKATSHGPGRSFASFMELSEEERASACEMDTVIGKLTDTCCLLTLYLRACHVQLPLLMPDKTARATVDALDRLEQTLGLEVFSYLFGLILTDNGSEFADVKGIERSCTEAGKRRCRVFFCDPMRSDQKGACERNHVEIRKMLPKGCGVSFDDLDEIDVRYVGSQVNSEPRKSLMGLSPLAMLRAADPASADALAGRLGIIELAFEDLDLTLGAVNDERRKRGLAPLA